MTLPLIRLSDIPYLDLSRLDGRRPLLMPFWDGERWHAWAEVQGGGYLDLKPVDLAHYDYVAERAARGDDLYVPFIDLMWQRATWSDVVPRIFAIIEDFHHLFAIVAKLEFFRRKAGELDSFDLEAFGQTELEYMVTVARSVFDLLHESIRTIWENHVRLLDENEEAKRKANKLRKSFAGMVLDGDGKPVTAEFLAGKYALPPSLCDAYVRQCPFFVELRSLRDRTVHGLGASPRVSLTEKGWAVETNHPAFRGFVTWKAEHYFNEHRASFLPIIARIILGTVTACSDIAAAFATEIALPSELAPGKNIFIRSPHSFVVVPLLAASRGEIFWWPEAG